MRVTDYIILTLGLLAVGQTAWAMFQARAARRQAGEMSALRRDLAVAGAALRAQEAETAGTTALLAQASGRFQELFQGLPVGAMCCDARGRIMEWNRAFERMYGLENPLGQMAVELAGGAVENPALAEAMARALAGESPEGVEWTYRRPDGEPMQVYSSLFPLCGADGAVTGLIGADVDISAQQAAEDALRQSEERLHALYNATSQQTLSFADKTDAVLRMGLEQFGLEVGVLARAVSAGEAAGEECYEIVQAISPGDRLRAGLAVPTERLTGQETHLGTPVRVGGAIWGILSFGGSVPLVRPFASGDREMVRLMAQWIGGEITRRQAEEALGGSEERFRSATESMTEGLLVMDAGGVVRLCNESAERIFGLTRSEIQAWSPFSAVNPEFLVRREDGSLFPQGSYPLVVSLRSGRPQRDVVMGLPRAGGGMVWVSVNATPLCRAGEDLPYAVVATFTDISERRRCEDQISAQMAEIKDYMVALECRTAQLEEANAELERLAMHDGLTGLGNRRAFAQRLELELGRAVRYDLPLSLLLLDVDFFKEYNDSFGHPAGDEVLRTLAQTLEAHSRETDFYARYGGEEFVVLLPHTDSVGTLTVAERLRCALADAPWVCRPVTASFGAATLVPAMSGGEDLVRAADRALYAAKDAGRDRVIHAETLPSIALPLPCPAG